MEYTINVTTLTEEDIDSIISGALTGSAYWCGDIRIEKDLGVDMSDLKYFSEKCARVLANNGALVFTDKEDNSLQYGLMHKSLVKGLDMYLNKHPECNPETLLEGQGDMCDMDEIIQYSLFGKIMYA